MHKRYHWPPRSKRNLVMLQNDRNYNDIETVIRNRLKAAPQFIERLDLETKLKGHSGCINCLEWSANGRYLLSGSDDNKVFMWDPFKSKSILDFQTPHSGNIFSVKFMPNSGDQLIVTGAADYRIFIFDVNRVSEPATPFWKCSCHSQRIKRLETAADNANLFWSAAEDGRILQFDIREPHVCRQDEKVCLIDLQKHIGRNAEAKCLAINQRRSEQLAVGASDAYARVYDRRLIKPAKLESHLATELSLVDNLSRECVTYYCPYHLNKVKDRNVGYQSKTITYLTFSPDGNELLVNTGSEQIYLYDLNNTQQPAYLSIPKPYRDAESTEISNDSNDCEMKAVNEPSTSSTKSVAYTKSSKLPKHVDELKKAGNDFMENEKYLQAINQYTECIHLLPNHPVFYLNRATAFMRRNWFGDQYAALRDCQEALRLDPTYVKAHFRMVRALFELGYVIEASQCLDELKKRFPNDANNKQVQLLTQDIQSHTDQGDGSNSGDDASPELSGNEIYWRTTAKDYGERFIGHCNIATDIKEVNFFGSDGMHVIAGSDEGSFYIWERPTAKIVGVFKGDSSILNCVQPHPHYCMLATSGIDNVISLWCPKLEHRECEYRVKYYETTVATNQQLMQADPFEIHTNGAVCRTS